MRQEALMARRPQLETRKTLPKASRRGVVSGARGRGAEVPAAGHAQAWRERVNQFTRDFVKGAS